MRRTTRTVALGTLGPGSNRDQAFWTAVTAIEVGLAVVVVVRDLLLPTLALLVLMVASLTLRHQGPSTLGFRRPPSWVRVGTTVATLTVLWTGVQLAVILPALEHVTGQRQDLSTFDDLQGDVATLAVLLVASWTLAALGEETAFRGYVQVRTLELLGPDRTGTVTIAAVAAAVLFGLIHLEQGPVGVGATFADALFFSWLARRSPAGLWAAVLAHGFNNTLGLTTYFLVGPVHGLW
jgi:membrane protease YdiL (CAAX protease family)